MVTVVAFHAHPDDEVILTGGTLARLAAEGHRVVIVVATSGAMRFVRADPAEAAEQLASILRAESADLLLSYDPVGGYGHRDHIRVHKVGALAAQLAGVRVLEATAPRELAIGALAVLTAVRLVVRHPMRDVPSYGAPRSAITRRVNVRRHAAAKRAAFAVHITPLNGKGRASRLMRLAVALPVPVFGLLFGREWFADPGVGPGPVLGDVLRSRP